jgi:uncharacterized cupin superfamily protein
MFRKQSEMPTQWLENCHGGVGRLLLKEALGKGDSELGIRFMHDDLLEPGASIGEHAHNDEEIYFVVEGNGSLILDGVAQPTSAGDVSLVQRGHSHGIVNTGAAPMRLLVVGFRPLA